MKYIKQLAFIVTASLSMRSFAGAIVIIAPNPVVHYSSNGKKLNIQGKLTDSSGNPLTGSSVVVTFRLYKHVYDQIGSAVWTESQSVTPQNGLFNVTLGNTTLLDPIPFNIPYYLSMQVAGDTTEMYPRQLLGASAYALGSLGNFDVQGKIFLKGEDIGLSLVPAGTVLAFAGFSAPAGYLACDGSAVSRTSFPNLFAAIGTAWGAGDGSSTFNLPDLRGRFLRGIDAGANRDPDKSIRVASNFGGNSGDTVGSIEGDAFRLHTHTADPHNHGINDPGHRHSYTFFGYETTGTPPHIPTGDPYSYDPAGSATSLATTGITIQNATVNIQETGGNETRPQNAAVAFIIKT